MGNFSVITVSREVESLGDEVALRLSRILGYELINREQWMVLLEGHSPALSPEPPEEEGERERWMAEVGKLLEELAEKRAFVLLGRVDRNSLPAVRRRSISSWWLRYR